MTDTCCTAVASSSSLRTKSPDCSWRVHTGGTSSSSSSSSLLSEAGGHSARPDAAEDDPSPLFA
jgi:hypothetical protein